MNGRRSRRCSRGAVVALVRGLEERIDELERRASRNSGNSSVSPSSDPPKSRAERRREARAELKELSKRKAGGQQGHEGRHRAMVGPERVDERTEHGPLGNNRSNGRRTVVDSGRRRPIKCHALSLE